MDLEKLKLKKDATDMMLEILYEVTQDNNMIFFKDTKNFYEKLSAIAMSKNVTSEQYEKLISMLKQFAEEIDNFVKTEKIEIKENQND